MNQYAREPTSKLPPYSAQSCVGDEIPAVCRFPEREDSVHIQHVGRSDLPLRCRLLVRCRLYFGAIDKFVHYACNRVTRGVVSINGTKLPLPLGSHRNLDTHVREKRQHINVVSNRIALFDFLVGRGRANLQVKFCLKMPPLSNSLSSLCHLCSKTKCWSTHHRLGYKQTLKRLSSEHFGICAQRMRVRRELHQARHT